MNAKEDKDSGEHWELIERSLEDADRMIYYVSKEKTEDKNDLECLEKLVKATDQIRKDQLDRKVSGEHVAEFFEQITLMSHIIYPVTSESLKVMDMMTLRPIVGIKEKYIHKGNLLSSHLRLLILLFFSLIALIVVTPGILIFLSEGSTISEQLETALKDRRELSRDLINDAKAYQSEWKKGENNQTRSDCVNIINIVKRLQFNKLRLDSLSLDLNEWNQSFLSQWVLRYIRFLQATDQSPTYKFEKFDVGKKEELSILEAIKSIQKNNCQDCGKLPCIQIADMPNPDEMKKHLDIRSKAVIVVQAFNNYILLLLFGCCGATAYILRKAIQQIHNHTFTGIGWKEFFRIILGTFTGFFLGYLSVTADLPKLLSDEGGPSGASPDTLFPVSPYVFAFLGGYSIDLLSDILNRFCYVITNDEKYLPAAEQMKRKVDVSKFIDKAPPFKRFRRWW